MLTILNPIKGASSYLMTLYHGRPIMIYEIRERLWWKLTLFNANYNADFDNPLWSAKNNIAGDKNTRWVATAGIDINPFKWLSIAGRFGYDTYKNDGYYFTHPNLFF